MGPPYPSASRHRVRFAHHAKVGFAVAESALVVGAAGGVEGLEVAAVRAGKVDELPSSFDKGASI